MLKAKPLTAKRIDKLGVGRYRDGSDLGRGLYLQITARKKGGQVIEPLKVAGGSWLLRYERGGHERWMGLGSLADFTLREARERARAARQKLADGIDPLDVKAADKAAKAIAEAKKITFEKAARQYFENKKEGWRSAKHTDQFINSLEKYAFPVIGSLPVGSIDKTLVMKVLEQPYKGKRLWDSVPETASRLRQRMEKVLGWATVRDYRSGENPARWKGFLETEFIVRAKTDKKIKHHAAMSYNDIGDFFTQLRKQNSIEATALEFLILTAARSNEVIGAKWDEFELLKVPVTTWDEEGHESTVPGPCWIVPGDRMKGFKRHRIPLSERAVEILKAVSRNREAGALVFDGLSDMDMWLLLTKTMGYAVTVHGFRSTFRDWAGDKTNYPREAAEKAIAHAVKDKTEASYWRADMYHKRIPLMADWARFCELPKRDATVTPLSSLRPLRRGKGGV